MSLTSTELNIINKIASDSAASRALLETHTAQISTIFHQQGIHANKITTVQTRQNECGAKKAHDAGNLPGTRTARNSNRLQFWAIIVALIGSPVVTAIVTYLITKN